MPHKSHFTTGEIATMFGVPGWAARRAVDALDEAIPRAGLYRLVPREMLPRVKAKLREHGYVPKAEVASA